MAELTPRAPAKLLRALQDGEIRRLGENRTERLDLRVAAAAGSRARLARETVAALRAHRWAGNVRELQNVLANLTITAPRFGAIERAHLPAAFRRPAPARPRTLAAAREDWSGRWCATRSTATTTWPRPPAS